MTQNVIIWMKDCGVNDMTFEEWLSYQDQMLSYYNTYQYDSLPYKEEEDEDESSDEDDSGMFEDEDESSDEDDEWDENCRSCSCSDDFCLSRVSSTSRYSHLSYDENHVCWCDPTYVYAVVVVTI